MECGQCRQRHMINARQNRTSKMLSRSLLGEEIHAYVTINNKSPLGIAQFVRGGGGGVKMASEKG